MNYLYKHNKISVTTADFNGLSSEIWKWDITFRAEDISNNIIWCNCAHMVDFHRPGHNYVIAIIRTYLLTFLIMGNYSYSRWLCTYVSIIVVYCS